MSAKITVVCPECGKAVKAAAEVAGKKVRCKYCSHTFRATAAPPTSTVARAADANASAPVAPVTPGRDDDDEGDGNPYQFREIDLAARCPECANEMESADAIICLHCGYNTVTRERLSLKKTHDITHQERFAWLLPGFLCAAGVLFLVLFDLGYCVLIQPVKDIWVLEFFGSGAIKMWLVIGSFFIMFFLGRFAILRLIFHPEPPEVEKF
jgi:DNA-directed RNA polymerase subunit RPC12/RpoP